MTGELIELANIFLPAYLFAGARKELLKQINDFPHERGYYSQIPEPRYLQGDGWSRFRIFNFETGEQRQVTGVILSNSCDISRSNKTVPGQRVIFAPRISLSRYIDRLRAAEPDETRVEAIIRSVRQQHVNNVFFLPAHGSMPDSMILLDNLHSEPLEHFWNTSDTRVLRLSDFGFWLFALKLSIHFTRLQEEVQRGVETAAQ